MKILVKLVLLIISSITFTVIILHNFGTQITSRRHRIKYFRIDPIHKNYSNKFEEKRFRYILQWTSPRNVPFVYMGKGREIFMQKNCSFTNCIVTSHKNVLKNLTDFDVIMFAGPDISNDFVRSYPNHRLPHQKYVFASIESSHNYPICDERFDNFFNWTWTYRLDSEVKWGYFIIKDSNNDIVGPSLNMDWIPDNDMIPVSEEFKAKLKNKTRMAAWFVSNCWSESGREAFALDLHNELQKLGNMSVDIYGKCTPKRCDSEDCFKQIDEHYFFYLSFENAFSEDYVTEKLLVALNHNAVPIVYGGADYSRFIPRNSYLDATKLGVKRLAHKMFNLTHNLDEYANYFKWKNHYSYHRQNENSNTDEYCKMCELVNDEEKMNETSIKKEFRRWWNPPGSCNNIF